MYEELQRRLEERGHHARLRLHSRAKEVFESKCVGLDGYSFFGLNQPYVVNAIESQENSVYHAIPPPGFTAYNYHMVQPKSELVIRVREERVGGVEWS